ncbi:MAG TPA: 4Fe-4S binding protein [Thermodesulfobacteriota bacterium]|mgnify:CR=1 FL=1|nr:4Fe-4S binding protein [Deltaproteobacteria bacterium]HNR13387.1 4Fe-4S binding protein [Thermodesulfobacteriota bacterium]HNU70592.1 4Fe-4S binding protein [Thermodesulfobacteriota bacterium]HOC39072.1 4Fe-4S binding protein [Thermodesulfobacteriota bacterium]
MDTNEKGVDRRQRFKNRIADAIVGTVPVLGVTGTAAADHSLNGAQDQDTYEKLGKHMSCLGMGFLQVDAFVDFLRQTLTPLEAAVCLGIPTVVIPLQAFDGAEIARGAALPEEEVRNVLEGLVKKNLIYSGPTAEGKPGYAFFQFGFGFPQASFWKGEDTPHARTMVRLIHNYLNPMVITETCGFETKPWRYVPVEKSIDVSRQAVYSYDAMEQIVSKAEAWAVCHCSCRIEMRLLTGTVCNHPTEVCMKFNSQARFVVERGVGKKITKEEALQILQKTEEAGLVHFVDNCQGEIQHNCNCCGCACWNVGTIRRRILPRDSFMATYYIRATAEDTCIACGACVEICPVQCIRLEGDSVLVDEAWCIGCGVCAAVCPTGSVKLHARMDIGDRKPLVNFVKLHETILNEKARQVLKKEGWGNV